jgi:hypothetical protein
MANSNKMNIEWHKACLYNSMITENNLVKEIERRQAELKRTHESNLFYAHQIATAEAEKRDSFDRDRFMVKRGTK